MSQRTMSKWPSSVPTCIELSKPPHPHFGQIRAPIRARGYTTDICIQYAYVIPARHLNCNKPASPLSLYSTRLFSSFLDWSETVHWYWAAASRRPQGDVLVNITGRYIVASNWQSCTITSRITMLTSDRSTLRVPRWVPSACKTPTTVVLNRRNKT